MQGKGYLFLLLLVMVLNGCLNAPDKHNMSKKNSAVGKPRKKIDLLDTILSQGKLIAITNYSSTDYFIYRGQPMGYQYNLVSRFAKFLHVDLEMRIEKDLVKSFQYLDSGKVDLMAMGLTETTERKSKLLFTKPIMFTRQVLVQRKPEGYQKMRTRDEIESHLLRNPLNLAKKTVYVHKGTVFVNRLKALMNEIADTIYIVEDDRETEQLIAAVANGEIDYTVADEHVALVDAAFYNNIDTKTFISFPQKIAWAVRIDQKRLADTINFWLDKFYKTLDSRLLYNKYFKNLSSRKRVNKSLYNSYGKGYLSPFDNIIKKASQQIGWDWRLLASLIYQESEFKPGVVSWVGARGLMQLMPDVMQKYGIDSTASPEEQIMAGTKYLKALFKQLPPEITDSVERIKFVLAAYNTGMGHVFDARRLAAKYGKNPNRWTDNTDYFILHLSEKKYYNDPVVRNGYVRGKETYNFVMEIWQRYKIYKVLIKDKSPDSYRKDKENQ